MLQSDARRVKVAVVFEDGFVALRLVEPFGTLHGGLQNPYLELLPCRGTAG